MKQGIYTVFDSKVEAYLQPFFARTHGEAIRSFETAVSQPDHQFHRHAEDYALFYVGGFDDESGVLEPVLAPLHLSSAHHIVSGSVMKEVANG